MSGPSMRGVSITTDGTARGSVADIDRGQHCEVIDPKTIVRASCSVRTVKRTGERCITATIWTEPQP